MSASWKEALGELGASLVREAGRGALKGAVRGVVGPRVDRFLDEVARELFTCSVARRAAGVAQRTWTMLPESERAEWIERARDAVRILFEKLGSS